LKIISTLKSLNLRKNKFERFNYLRGFSSLMQED
jgi:hypothetical protein